MNWEVRRLDHLVTEVRTTVDPAALGDQEVDHYSIPALEAHGGPERQPANEIQSHKQRLAGGEVLVSRLNPRKARVLTIPPLGDRIALASGEFVVLRPTGIHSRYLEYSVLSEATRQYLDGAVQSVTRSHQRVRPEQLLKMKFRLPLERTQQRAIADFLDTETARIDALIAKKRRMIDLLTERWRAELRRDLAALAGRDISLRHIARIKRGQSPRPIDDPVYFDAQGSHGWVRIEDATRSDIYLRTTRERLSEVGRAKSVSVGPGTLLVSIAASVGQPIITAMDCCYHDGWVGLLEMKAVPEFVYLCLVLPETFGGLGQIGTQVNINSEIVGRVRVPDIPVHEQRSFSARLFERRARALNGQEVLKHQLDLLQQHRQALITAAVTGELEVPEVAA